MSDEQTPEATIEAAPDPTADETAVTTDETPSTSSSRTKRGKGRVSRAASAPEAATASPADAEITGPPDAGAAAATATTPEADGADVAADTGAREMEAGEGANAYDASASAPGTDATSFPNELSDAELFDPAEVANAPRAPHPLKPVVEALIFASPEPLTVKAMARLLEEHTKEDIEAALAEVREAYTKSDGLQLVEVAGGYQIVTRPELYEWVRRLFKERTTSKLSVQALETLAVIAYKQPVTSGEIAEIRGVSATTGVLNTLLDRKLVKIVGRKQVVGRPFMYGTTREFLDKFGLRDLSDLPKVEDMSEALGFDLPTPVDEADGVSLPFEAADAADSSAPGPSAPADAPAPDAPVTTAADGAAETSAAADTTDDER